MAATVMILILIVIITIVIVIIIIIIIIIILLLLIKCQLKWKHLKPKPIIYHGNYIHVKYSLTRYCFSLLLSLFRNV